MDKRHDDGVTQMRQSVAHAASLGRNAQTDGPITGGKGGSAGRNLEASEGVEKMGMSGVSVSESAAV